MATLVGLDVKVERIIWIPGLGLDPSTDFTDFLDDIEVEDAWMFYGEGPRGTPWAVPPVFGYDHERDAFWAKSLAEVGTPGFFVHVSAPTREEAIRNLTWLYAENLDELVAKAIAWARGRPWTCGKPGKFDRGQASNDQ